MSSLKIRRNAHSCYFFFRFVWFSGSSEFVRVEPAAGPDPSLAGTAQQGIASTAVGQGHGTEEGAGIVHGVESDTVGWQQLRQFAAVQTRTRGRADRRATRRHRLRPRLICWASRPPSPAN